MKQILESPLIAGTMPQCEVEIDGLFEFLHPKTTCDLVSCEHHFICSKYEGSPKGTILPIPQSIFSPLLEEYRQTKNLENEKVLEKTETLRKIEANWNLVGSGKAHVYCGAFWKKACLGHHPPMNLPDDVVHQKGLDGKCLPNMGFAKVKKMSCHRAKCPICKDDWKARQIARAKKRFEVFEEKFNRKEKRHLKRCHDIFSIPKKDWGLSQKKMQQLAYKYLKILGIMGGSIVYHPKRERCGKCGVNKPQKKDYCPKCGSNVFVWYYSPHFHIYCHLWNGWIDGAKVKKLEKETGWVFKNIGKRPLSKSLGYQLGRAGVSPKTKAHVLKWFGSMSYNKLHVPKFRGEIPTCPWGHPLEFAVFQGKKENDPKLPDKDGACAMVPKEGWIILPKPRNGRNKVDFYEDGY